MGAHHTAAAGSGGGGLTYLRAEGVGLVLDLRGPGLPVVLHWGADLGDLSPAELADLAVGCQPPVTPNTLDVPAVRSVLPEHAQGWFGTPGLQGSRDGADWSPSFTVARTEVEQAAEGGRVVVSATDATARLSATVVLELTASGVLRARASVRNDDPARAYQLDALQVALPVPPQARELLDLAGRHLRERIPQRQPFHVGTRLREGRRGRTGTDATLVLVAGTEGFGFRSGEVWGVHVGWSGNHRTFAERVPSGEAVLGGGELLLPGELRLLPGEEYVGPELFASCGRGLDELSGRFHRFLRSRPAHPTRARPRPVVLNTWEAVFFEHDQDRLTALVDAAAQVGAERFVLDDGWFRHRRDDHAGLGDWYVDEGVYPAGLHPLVAHVRQRGLEFGLWVEPEMVNPDSDLAREHPDWILSTGGRVPLPARHQQVLDLSHPEAFAYLFDRLDALVREYGIGFLKWDHNRDLLDAGRGPTRAPAGHAQTAALYRLLDELRARHPGLEIESCSSGGGRVDLGILQRTDRVWASDCNDALERQAIQRWTGLLLPPEMIGSHVGPARAHTTSRVQDLAFRAGTALFGHLGIEWDLTAATSAERSELAGWVDLHRRFRGLLHSGVVVHGDDPEPSPWLHGVVATDAREALFAAVATRTGVWAAPGRVRLPGLDPTVRYTVSPLPPGDRPRVEEYLPAAWVGRAPLTLPGSVLGSVGLELPNLRPEQLLLLHVLAVDGGPPPAA